jgi:uncharacterized membrane protein
VNTVLTWVSLIGNLSFLGLLVAGFLNALKRTDLLRQERAFRLYLAAAGAILVALAANVMRENWPNAGIAAFNLALIAVSTYFTGKTCDRLEGADK